MPRRPLAVFVSLLTIIRACFLVPFAVIVPVAAAAESDQGPRISLIRDAEIETLLLNFATPLFRAAGLDSSLLRIQLVRDGAINAFVTSGNRMYIYTGLLQQADTASEVIGVMAHETGHVMHNDPSKLPEQMREAMLKAVAGMLIGAAAGVLGHQPDAGMAAALGGQQLAMRQFLSFSRAQEAGADQAAMLLLDRNGWSARGLAALFDRLKDQELLVVDRQDPYMQSHPLTRERIAFVAEHVAHSPNSDRPLPPGFETGFAMAKAKLDGFLDAPMAVFRKYPDSDHSAPAAYARAIALYRSGRPDEAVAQLDRLIATQRGNPWLVELKGQILFEAGRARDALAVYRDAARLAGEQPLIRAALAHAMIESNDPLLIRPAIHELQRALDRDREDADTWRLLATAWGRAGDIGQANLALAEEAMINDDIYMARRFAREAEKNLPPGASKLRAQDIANAAKKENLPKK
jgi:predicted Zn-dependent protease